MGEGQQYCIVGGILFQITVVFRHVMTMSYEIDCTDVNIRVVSEHFNSQYPVEPGK